MPERKSTGGTKEFHYNKEDLDKIRSTDTESSKAFKKAYAEWNHKRPDRVEQQSLDILAQKQRRNLMVIFVFLLICIFLLLVLRFWK